MHIQDITTKSWGGKKMTLAIGQVNPFIRAQKVQPIESSETKKQEQIQPLNNVATNPIKPANAAKADSEFKLHSDCITSYGMAMVAMQNSGQCSGAKGGSNGGGAIGTETSGSIG